MTITAAADGSALGNPGPAGWAWYIDDENWAAGGWKHATNNQGELMAVLDLFLATAHLDDDLHILCDSQYVINCVTKWMLGWKKKGWRKGDGKPVMNVDLLKQIDDAIVGRRYRFEWVKGHVGHVLNEAADSRARAVAEAFQRGAAVPEGPGLTTAGGGGAAESRAGIGRADAGRAAAGGAAASAATTDPVGAQPVSGRRVTTQPETPSLFSFDDEPADAPSRTITVALSETEHARLAERARSAGLRPEDYLRGLI
ncbi:ribonuclease HI [Labedella gwakjiensis]|uniref:ribonuclease H n=1 Tax=Labedella gwakjiensis TaxID=390269 RepID=A0A2P8GZ71_9MICO|nr:ribonuclease H [Labedella gwakjiensis]PSL39262.1 ribonuclease HI [Labedella gwakjiensis]RUQ86315.1 ribonuclease HI [Labedella gwakjiensis]